MLDLKKLTHDYFTIRIKNPNLLDLNKNYSQRNFFIFSRKNVVLKKLAKFWKQSDKLITMDKICNGMLRSEAAGTFFELLRKHNSSLCELTISNLLIFLQF